MKDYNGTLGAFGDIIAGETSRNIMRKNLSDYWSQKNFIDSLMPDTPDPPVQPLALLLVDEAGNGLTDEDGISLEE